jgi:hypothetical protein
MVSRKKQNGGSALSTFPNFAIAMKKANRFLGIGVYPGVPVRINACSESG